LTFPFDGLIYLGFIIWLIIVIYLFFKRTKSKWYLLLLSSWSLVSIYSFFSGTKDYFLRQATIKTYGLPSDEFWNLDPDLRIWNSSSGCAVMGNEMFTQSPNNIAVQFLTKCLGTQPHVYNGYYPSKKEVDSELSINATLVKFNYRQNSLDFNLNGQTIKLKDSQRGGFHFPNKVDSAKVLVFKKECIFFQSLGDTAKTLLADKKTGEVFARYSNNQIR
jgi:hypothetical protein